MKKIIWKIENLSFQNVLNNNNKTKEYITPKYGMLKSTKKKIQLNNYWPQLDVVGYTKQFY